MSRDAQRSLWLFQNLLDDIQWPGHTLTASTNPTGAEAYRVATGRRAAIDAWTAVTTNSTHWIQVDCAVPRAANLCVVDRGHNLDNSSKGFQLEARSSTALAWAPVWGSTFTPLLAGPAPSTTIWGARTWEGALLREFPLQVWRYWRFRVPPSTGYAPSIRNLALGFAWSPSAPAITPSDFDGSQVNFQESVTPSGWRGVGRVANTRVGSALYRLQSYGEDEAMRHHLSEYEQGRVSWCVPFRGRAEQAFCTQIPPVTVPKPQEPGQLYRTAAIPFREHEPLPL